MRGASGAQGSTNAEKVREVGRRSDGARNGTLIRNSCGWNEGRERSGRWAGAAHHAAGGLAPERGNAFVRFVSAALVSFKAFSERYLDISS